MAGDYFESDAYRAAVSAAVVDAPTPGPAQKAALRRIFADSPAVAAVPLPASASDDVQAVAS